MKWRELATESTYQTAVAIQNELARGNVREAPAGLEELIDAVARSERRAIKSQLVRLMVHVLRWICQPDQRPRSWSASIQNAREDIREIQEETPSLTDDVVRRMWDRAFEQARGQAEGEMNCPSNVASISWEQVFEHPYSV
jgi:hypothetical protein